MVRMHFDNTFARELTGLYVSCSPDRVPNPRLLELNRDLASELGLDVEHCASQAALEIWVGNRIPEGAEPLAQIYAGHQFGHFSPQLGDGRAHLLGEVVDSQGRRRDIALKGSGRTPFSRGGDGKAALGPVLREFLMGEAMHALGIPTTRVLSAVATGETVYRDRPLPGAVLVRIAASHIRVGTFEYFASRGDLARVKRLADYCIARHFPELHVEDIDYAAFLRAVLERQVRLVAQWTGVGFIHGVMNTDNMAISGETIDFGPCAFMEMYDPETVYSSIDARGRYAFGNQAKMAQWNLARFAETLLPLCAPSADDAAEVFTDIIAGFSERFATARLGIYRQKIGLLEVGKDADDTHLIEDYLRLLQTFKVDFTLGFRRLSAALLGDESALRSLFAGTKRPLDTWLARWRDRIAEQPGDWAERAAAMDATNPLYIPRNRLVEEALLAATDSQDLSGFERLWSVLQEPFRAREVPPQYALPGTRIENERHQTFCGT